MVNRRNDDAALSQGLMPDHQWNGAVMSRLSEQFRLILELRHYMSWEQVLKMDRLRILTCIHPAPDTAVIFDEWGGPYIIPRALHDRLRKHACGPLPSREACRRDNAGYLRAFYKCDGYPLSVTDVLEEVQRALNAPDHQC